MLFPAILLPSFVIQFRKEKKEEKKTKPQTIHTEKGQLSKSQTVPNPASDDFRLPFPTCAYCILIADQNKHKLLYKIGK